MEAIGLFAIQILIFQMLRDNADVPGAPNENIVQNHLNIVLLNVF